MRNDQVLEHDVVVCLQLDAEDGALVADDVDLFLDISLLYDYTGFRDRVRASVDTFDEVDSCKRFNAIESVLQGREVSVGRWVWIDQGSFTLLSV